MIQDLWEENHGNRTLYPNNNPTIIPNTVIGDVLGLRNTVILHLWDELKRPEVGRKLHITTAGRELDKRLQGKIEELEREITTLRGDWWQRTPEDDLARIGILKESLKKLKNEKKTLQRL
jgi:hypothetical protein